MMSPWMLVHRADGGGVRAASRTPSSAYLDHWFALLDGRGARPTSSADVADTDLAARDLRNRANIFNPDVDPVWAQVARLLGDEAIEDDPGPAARQHDPVAAERSGVTDDGGAAPPSRPASGSSGSRGSGTAAPSLFDAEGNHVGFERVDRASVVEDGVARYWMNTQLEARGPLRNRFELGAQFDFGIVDSDENRVYCGPDFYGTGQPYGLFVDAHYYSPGWQADLRTWNQVLPDGETQVYSSVLHDGWAVCAVFNGVYKRTFDHDDQPRDAAVRRGLDRRRDPARPDARRCCRPRSRAPGPARSFVHDRTQAQLGEVAVAHRARAARRCAARATGSPGTARSTRSYTFERYRDGARVQYDGPEVFGNATAYGRALFTSQHLVERGRPRRGEDPRPRGPARPRTDPRARGRLAAVPRRHHSPTSLHGLLTWEAPMSMTETSPAGSSSSPAAPAASASASPRELRGPRLPRGRLRPLGRRAWTRRSPTSPSPAGRSPASPPTSTTAPPCRRCGTTPWRRSAGSTSGSTTPASPRRAGRCREVPEDDRRGGRRDQPARRHERLRRRAGRASQAQAGGGWLWNMEGFGSGGQKQPGHDDVRRHQARGHLPHRVAGQGDQGRHRSRSASCPRASSPPTCWSTTTTASRRRSRRPGRSSTSSATGSRP